METATTADLWLHDRRYDLFWYLVVPVLLFFGLQAYCTALGPNGPMYTYMTTAVLTGLTHNSITWLLILPADSRKFYAAGTLFVPFLVTSLVLIPSIVLFQGPFMGYALALNITIAYFHITRQHQGMLHVCDGRYVQATGDQGFRAYARDLRWLVGAVAATGLTAKLSGGPMLMGFLKHPLPFPLHLPPQPAWVLGALSVFLAVRLGYHTWQRHRAGHRFPVMHAVMGGTALANLVAASCVPNASFFLTLALVSSYHNLQYFAFCYTHHHLRARETGEDSLYARLAREQSWGWWFAIPMACGLVFAGLTALLPPLAADIAATWFMTSHYFVDGNIWRRKFYPQMGRLGAGRVAAEPRLEEVAA
ncbi:MAG: hypothetical protein JWM80_4439 [Cyanobacteria bacterium RYN_339]|nr:hypothetical protein [Cyanobacteria bacterium RYN_339]